MRTDDLDRALRDASHDERLPEHVRDALGVLVRARAEIAHGPAPLDADVLTAVREASAGRASGDAVAHAVARALGARAAVYSRAR